MDIIEGLKARAKAKQGTVVLPESGDERTLRAAEQLIREEIAKVILVGDPSTVAAKSRELGITDAGWQVTNPNTFARIDEFATWLYGKRKDKGLSREEANALVRNELYFGTLLVKFGIADGMVAGAANTTADVLRAGLQVVGVMPGLKTVSSTFIMVVPDYMDGWKRRITRV